MINDDAEIIIVRLQLLLKCQLNVNWAVETAATQTKPDGSRLQNPCFSVSPRRRTWFI